MGFSGTLALVAVDTGIDVAPFAHSLTHFRAQAVMYLELDSDGFLWHVGAGGGGDGC